MTTAAASIPQGPATAPRAGLRDFPDRISPMLVKELRQGLKSPVFVWGLIVMQLVLAMMSLVSMDEGNTSESSMAFWWSVAVTVCILLPFRVSGALREEMGGNTMDTLVLTRLSAWRITLGKWLATGALQVLIVITTLPYLILRYFAGGVNTPMELLTLGFMVILGLLVTAVMLGLSWFRYFFARAVIMLLVLYGAAGACTLLIMAATRDQNIYNDLGWAGIGFITVMVIWAGFFFLDIGASQIAPISENRSTRRRLVALAVFVLGGLCCLGIKEVAGGLVCGTILSLAMALVAVQALGERRVDLAPILRPFVKRGWAGRLAGRVLYPGWHTGLVFTLLIAMLALALIVDRYLGTLSRFGVTREVELVMLVSLATGTLGLLILPVVFWGVFRKMARWNSVKWISVILVTGLFHWLIFFLASMPANSPGIARAALILPTGGLTVQATARLEARGVRGSYYGPDWLAVRREREEQLCILSTISFSVWMLAAIVLAMKEMRLTRRAEDELVMALAKG